ncbi:MAG: Polyprenyl synthetase, partial [Microgenomates group bacterium GW2011_GWA2_37_6]
EVGEKSGIAFQIQDDLLDVKYNVSQTKKSSFNDVYQNQHTLLSNFIHQNGTKEQKTALGKLFGKKLNDNDKKTLKTIFRESGAIEYAEKEIYNNLNQASEILKKIKIDGEYKILFNKLISDLINRSN